MLENLKKEVCEANKALPKNGLVVWTSGNVLGREPESDLVVVKPSGVAFDELTPEKMVVMNLEGEVVEGDYVIINTPIGGERILEAPIADPVPRVC